MTTLPGVATLISLSTYTFTDTYTPADPQWVWLQETLGSIDRVKTPWVVVQMHAPMVRVMRKNGNKGEKRNAPLAHPSPPVAFPNPF